LKSIVETSTGLSKYLLADDVVITSNSDDITLGNPPENIICDLNINTVTITENISNAPDDWVGNKYFFDGVSWTENSDWTEPPAPDDDGSE